MELLNLEMVHHYQSQTRLPCAAAIEAIGETCMHVLCPNPDPNSWCKRPNKPSLCVQASELAGSWQSAIQEIEEGQESPWRS